MSALRGFNFFRRKDEKEKEKKKEKVADAGTNLIPDGKGGWRGAPVVRRKRLNIEDFGPDVIVRIFSFLVARTVINLSTVCKQWYRVLYLNDTLWKRITVLAFKGIIVARDIEPRMALQTFKRLWRQHASFHVVWETERHSRSLGASWGKKDPPSSRDAPPWADADGRLDLRPPGGPVWRSVTSLTAARIWYGSWWVGFGPEFARPADVDAIFMDRRNADGGWQYGEPSSGTSLATWMQWYEAVSPAEHPRSTVRRRRWCRTSVPRAESMKLPKVHPWTGVPLAQPASSTLGVLGDLSDRVIHMVEPVWCATVAASHLPHHRSKKKFHSNDPTLTLAYLVIGDAVCQLLNPNTAAIKLCWGHAAVWQALVMPASSTQDVAKGLPNITSAAGIDTYDSPSFDAAVQFGLHFRNDPSAYIGAVVPGVVIVSTSRQVLEITRCLTAATSGATGVALPVRVVDGPSCRPPIRRLTEVILERGSRRVIKAKEGPPMRIVNFRPLTAVCPREMTEKAADREPKEGDDAAGAASRGSQSSSDTDRSSIDSDEVRDLGYRSRHKKKDQDEENLADMQGGNNSLSYMQDAGSLDAAFLPGRVPAGSLCPVTVIWTGASSATHHVETAAAERQLDARDVVAFDRRRGTPILRVPPSLQAHFGSLDGCALYFIDTAFFIEEDETNLAASAVGNLRDQITNQVRGGGSATVKEDDDTKHLLKDYLQSRGGRLSQIVVIVCPSSIWLCAADGTPIRGVALKNIRKVVVLRHDIIGIRVAMEYPPFEWRPAVPCDLGDLILVICRMDLFIHTLSAAYLSATGLPLNIHVSPMAAFEQVASQFFVRRPKEVGYPDVPPDLAIPRYVAVARRDHGDGLIDDGASDGRSAVGSTIGGASSVGGGMQARRRRFGKGVPRNVQGMGPLPWPTALETIPIDDRDMTEKELQPMVPPSAPFHEFGPRIILDRFPSVISASVPPTAAESDMAGDESPFGPGSPRASRLKEGSMASPRSLASSPTPRALGGRPGRVGFSAVADFGVPLPPLVSTRELTPSPPPPSGPPPVDPRYDDASPSFAPP